MGEWGAMSSRVGGLSVVVRQQRDKKGGVVVVVVVGEWGVESELSSERMKAQKRVNTTAGVIKGWLPQRSLSLWQRAN